MILQGFFFIILVVHKLIKVSYKKPLRSPPLLKQLRRIEGKKMTKSETLQVLAEKLGKTRKEVSEFIDALVELASSETKKHGEFTVPGLGKLVKKRRDARQGRNPATGETIQIPAKTVVKFRLAKSAKDAIL